MKIVSEEGWDFYRYRMEEEIVVAGFCEEAREVAQDAFPYCARIMIPIAEPTPHGGPDDAEAEVLWKMEDTLAAALEAAAVHCHLLGRLTYGATRELIFQLADWDAFRSVVGSWMTQQKTYEIEVAEHDGWEFFLDRVWPSENDWLWIYDRRMVDNLIQAGSDVSKPHDLEFLFVGETDRLEQMSARLTERGYHLIKLDTEEKQLTMAKPMLLDVDTIWRESLHHAQASEELELNFKGWESQIVK